MRNLAILLFPLAITSCGISLKTAKRIFSENKVQQRRVLNNAPLPAGKSYLIIVFSDGDSLRLNQPITKVLKMDTSKNDASFYRVLTRDFVVVKLHRKEFESVIADTVKCRTDSVLKADYAGMDVNKSFLFISSEEEITMYGERTLDSPKEEIHDLIWVKFGP